MKKSLITAAFLTVISAASFAGTKNGTTELSNTSKFQVVENTNCRFDLYYVSESFDNVSVRILDENKKVVNTDKVSDIKAFKRTYNLKGLPTGNYTIEVKNGEGKAEQIVFHNPTKNTSFQTTVGKLPNQPRFKVIVGPSSTNKMVSVKIYNDNDQLLMQESIEGTKGFSKVYDLTKLNTKYVTFKLSNGQEFTSFTRDLN